MGRICKVSAWKKIDSIYPSHNGENVYKIMEYFYNYLHS